MMQQQIKKERLRQVQMRQVQMRQAQMRQAQMRQVQMRQAQMRQAQMRQVQMRQVQMRQVQMRERQIRQVQEEEDEQMQNKQGITYDQKMNKTIYMCYKTLPEIQHHSKNWKRLNPDWNIELYDNNLCEKFLLKEYGKLHADIFNFIQDGPIKSDFWRVCVIYKYGGLYVDADIEPIAPLSEYIEPNDYFVTCLSAGHGDRCNPHIIFAYKNNEILKACIDKYIYFFLSRKKYSYWGWSIVKIFESLPTLKKFIRKKNLQTIEIYNRKYKFLQEETEGGNYGPNDKCTYNGKTVLKNRYKNYNNHKFI